ncbi:IclR family transcriptional regulator [Melghirimyces algeriensis]|uniref:Transcriptional regulator, IclR family n=1 Tax=Melghirimyces algeriensis TaxID=910412 RepID=A0A521BFG2_9BACL|nr:IclR family transcriptional regulator [Melghirimyces algeriensis]SMO45837.1 transcriptional regulator, IclR family [Melghirimyces algeriensis]
MQHKNKTVMKMMEVLNLFLTHEELNLNEMVQLSGLPKTSVFRMAGTLEDMGFLKKDENGKYSLGLLFLQFGQLVSSRLGIRNIAYPYMEALRNEIDEAVNLVIRDGDEAIYIEKLDTNQPVRVYTQTGRRAPLYAGACPRIILAYASDQEILEYMNNTELRRYASGTITDKEQLMEVLRKSKKEGYSISHSELFDNTTAVAAPIFDANGAIAAGLSIVGPDVRIQSEHLPGIIAKVKRTASQISEELGWKNTIG